MNWWPSLQHLQTLGNIQVDNWMNWRPSLQLSLALGYIQVE